MKVAYARAPRFVTVVLGTPTNADATPLMRARVISPLRTDATRRRASQGTRLVGGLIAAAVVAIAALCCIGAMAKKEKEGKPVFAPVHNPVNERVAEKA